MCVAAVLFNCFYSRESSRQIENKRRRSVSFFFPGRDDLAATLVRVLTAAQCAMSWYGSFYQRFILQRFKTIYFSDHPASSTSKRNLKVAFGGGAQEVYERIAHLSSEDIRRAIGIESLSELQSKAESKKMSVNAFCVESLREGVRLEGPKEMKTGSKLAIDPIQTTFRGGLAEPLHDWYPYLEGYSPDFVNAVLDEFAPQASRILDPFGGSGTTPLAVAKRGGTAFYCELNPLMQTLISTKVRAVAQNSAGRVKMIKELDKLAERVLNEPGNLMPDINLSDAYSATFGDSEFFERETWCKVLQLRSWLDEISSTTADGGALATIAVVSSLLSCSNLIRRGDVRFRKSAGEWAARSQNLLVDVSDKLKAMAFSIENLKTVENLPILICGDAKRLERLSPIDLDAVVTSPPYLNGTNYYRNTKIELWFLRALKSSEDLSKFRSQTVTAGINDVTVDKDSSPIDSRVGDLLSELQEKSYDRRIGQMVGSYFREMEGVFLGLERHMKEGAPLLMDIGDSAYSGVHVDTPGILQEMLERRGWTGAREVVLRKRSSRSGQVLRQSLIVANAPARKAVRARRTQWSVKWSNFKATLPHQTGEYTKRNWGHSLHSLCSYQGKMKPSLANHLVDSFLSAGDLMLDPFGGVGTIPFEAANKGVRSFMFDISPVALPVSVAKLQPATFDDCDAVLLELDGFIRSTRLTTADRNVVDGIKFNGLISDYFHASTFDELLKARRYFQEHPPHGAARALVFSSLLHVLHGNRPYALSRRSHPITPFAPTGEAIYKNVVEKVREKVLRAVAEARDERFVPGVVLQQDATALWPKEVDNLDAILTSPPFFDSTRFYLANWMRLWFAGWLAEDFRVQPSGFVDERQKLGLSIYESILRQSRERLKPGGVLVLHLGMSRKCDMAVEIEKIARPWFRKTEIFRESVEHCESHGIRDKGTVVEHTYLVLY